MLWSEEYRPSKSDQTVVNKGLTHEITEWLLHWKKGQILLVSGPCGTGKTTSCYMACAQSGRRVIEFNASEDRGKNALKNYVFHADKQCVLMDEIDDSPGLASFASTVPLPVIFICNDSWSKGAKALKGKKCREIAFRSVSSMDIFQILGVIAKEKKLGMEDYPLRLIASSHGGDIRASINSLQLSGSTRDSEPDIFVTAKKVLSGRMPADTDDLTLLNRFAHENYLEGCIVSAYGLRSAPDMQTLKHISETSEYLSRYTHVDPFMACWAVGLNMHHCPEKLTYPSFIEFAKVGIEPGDYGSSNKQYEQYECHCSYYISCGPVLVFQLGLTYYIIMLAYLHIVGQPLHPVCLPSGHIVRRLVYPCTVKTLGIVIGTIQEIVGRLLVHRNDYKVVGLGHIFIVYLGYVACFLPLLFVLHRQCVEV